MRPVGWVNDMAVRPTEVGELDRPLRVALVGCGTVARRQHIPGFQALTPGAVDITVFCSRSRAAAEAARDAWGGGAVVTDWRTAVARDDVDAVDVLTPNALHAQVAIAAAEAGRHVLVEKPIATSVADADAMIEAAARRGVVLMTAHNGRYAPGMLAAAQAVRAGGVGEVTAVEAYLAHGGPGLWAPDATWFYDRDDAGGGSLIDLGVHAVDNVRAVTGDEFAEVGAMLSDLRGGVELNGQIVFRLAGGALGFVKASWNAPYGNDRQMVVWGRDGELVVAGGEVSVRRAGGTEAPVPAAPARDLYADFVGACAGRSPASPSGVDGRAALAVVLAAYRSHALGAFVRPD